MNTVFPACFISTQIYMNIMAAIHKLPLDIPVVTGNLTVVMQLIVVTEMSVCVCHSPLSTLRSTSSIFLDGPTTVLTFFIFLCFVKLINT